VRWIIRSPRRPSGENDRTDRISGVSSGKLGPPSLSNPPVVTLELIVNRHNLAPNVGHLCVTSNLVLGELRHLGPKRPLNGE
jgi:hypothetical protein